MLTDPARDHLQLLLEELERAAKGCLQAQAPTATLLFILASTELLALYYGGSRRPVGQRGSRWFYQFLTHYFPRFNADCRDPRGRYRRIRIPLSPEGGKAHKRLKLPSALIFLFRRGVLEELVAPPDQKGPCVLLNQGMWGFQIRTEPFLEDFLETLKAYEKDVLHDSKIRQRFLNRFHTVHHYE
jgi:hypothetical protein